MSSVPSTSKLSIPSTKFSNTSNKSFDLTKLVMHPRNSNFKTNFPDFFGGVANSSKILYEFFQIYDSYHDFSSVFYKKKANSILSISDLQNFFFNYNQFISNNNNNNLINLIHSFFFNFPVKNFKKMIKNDTFINSGTKDNISSTFIKYLYELNVNSKNFFKYEKSHLVNPKSNFTFKKVYFDSGKKEICEKNYYLQNFSFLRSLIDSSSINSSYKINDFKKFFEISTNNLITYYYETIYLNNSLNFTLKFSLRNNTKHNKNAPLYNMYITNNSLQLIIVFNINKLEYYPESPFNVNNITEALNNIKNNNIKNNNDSFFKHLFDFFINIKIKNFFINYIDNKKIKCPIVTYESSNKFSIKKPTFNDIKLNIDTFDNYSHIIINRFFLALKRSGDWGQSQLVKLYNDNFHADNLFLSSFDSTNLMIAYSLFDIPIYNNTAFDKCVILKKSSNTTHSTQTPPSSTNLNNIQKNSIVILNDDDSDDDSDDGSQPSNSTNLKNIPKNKFKRKRNRRIIDDSDDDVDDNNLQSNPKKIKKGGALYKSIIDYKNIVFSNKFFNLFKFYTYPLINNFTDLDIKKFYYLVCFNHILFYDNSFNFNISSYEQYNFYEQYIFSNIFNFSNILDLNSFASNLFNYLDTYLVNLNSNNNTSSNLIHSVPVPVSVAVGAGAVGGGFKNKYLKYKSKYLESKFGHNNFNIVLDDSLDDSFFRDKYIKYKNKYIYHNFNN